MLALSKHRALPKKFLLLSLASLLLALVFQLSLNSKASAAYEPGRLIDNAVFLDAQSMSATQLQNFLVSQGAGLANMSFLLDCDLAGSQAKQMYLSLGAPCGQQVPASHIIYYSAQVYGLSPKVILATMQKEQSVVTAPNPASWQINQAMGYGCPTSGSCESNSSFFYQIDNGSWALRFHYERARGNNSWWFQGSSWVCGSSKPLYYTPNLYPGQTVTFHDPYNGSGIAYAGIYIQNAATSALYCYTPHTFNNHTNSPHPNELKGSSRCYPQHPPMGSVGRCYTGSYNFVLFFELWFDSTKIPDYRALPIAQSPVPYIKQGESVGMYARFKNTGNQSWYDDTSAYSAGRNPVRLATDIPLSHLSTFASGWVYAHRPGINFARVYDINGTIKPGAHVAEPGESVEFWFAYKASHTLTPGTYIEGFRPIVEGLGPMNDTGTYFTINVAPAIYTAQFIDQSTFPDVTQYQKATAFIRYKNTGNVIWHDATSSPGSGQLPIQLATDYPLNRNSALSKFWPYPSRAAINFSVVYESDGVTLAPPNSQHLVRPGQIVKFSFDMMATAATQPRFYSENLRPIIQGLGPMNDTGTWIGINVRQANYSAAFAGQSNFPTIVRGGSGPAYFLYKNTGNVAWYDNNSAWGAGQLPVRLGTDNPLNRSSIFGANWAFGKTRAASVFNAVYEADGTTPASNQNVVQPGQIGRFSFNFDVPASTAMGYYPEVFRPIVEGLGPMNNVGTYLGVTVTN